jgi:apolipoprotein N-acyltransferase
MAKNLSLALVSSLLFIASFPPFGLGLLALVALAPLLLALEGARRPFLLGWLSGWVAFTGVAWWVYYAMAHFGGIPPFVAVPLMLLMTAVMAFFWGLFGWAYSRLRRSLPAVPAIVAVPVLWTASEYLRAKLPDLEFPWALLGNALSRQLALIQVADLGGVWAVSFLAALLGAGCAALARSPRGRGWNAGWRPLAVSLAALAICAVYGGLRLAEPAPERAVKVAVVQGNVSQSVKWDRRFREETFGTHEELTREAARGGADLISWSESATAFFYQREPEYQERLAELARETGAPLLFGSPAYETVGGERSLRNRAYLLCAGGEVAGWQDKQQLVPFGEFVPFAKLLFFARPLVQAVGNFEPGEGPRLLGAPERRFGALVCYEVIFPDLVRRFAAAGATFLVNITNDAWYERSAASAQQFAHLAFRAVENRRPIARAANTGISGFVDANGRVLAASPLFVRGQWAAELPLPSRTTLYTRWGDWLPRLCVLMSLAALLAPRFNRIRGRSTS